jgi:DNA-binding CsgD family transcriptional regulator
MSEQDEALLDALMRSSHSLTKRERRCLRALLAEAKREKQAAQETAP